MHAPEPSDSLARALDEAVAGRRRVLFDLLARGSRLPGARANDALAEAFAEVCRGRGPLVDPLVFAMARLSADEAPGATALEFLPVCGLLAIGWRAAADASVRTVSVAELHAHADDLRFRVRDAVVEALARVGSTAGDDLVGATASWMDGYFHAAAVVRAVGLEPWLTHIHDPALVLSRLDEAFALAREAPRAAARYPGRKALIDALGRTPALVALRFGVPAFDAVLHWASVQDPDLQAALESMLAFPRLAARFRDQVDRVRAAIHAHRPAPRNPDHDVGSTRDRSRARRRKSR